MAKRKTKVVKVATNEPITYTGTVTVKSVRKGKVVSSKQFHNNGYAPLFIFLLQCLANTQSYLDRPTDCYAVNKSDTGYTFVSGVGTSFANSSITVSKDSDNQPYIEYNFYLPYQSQYLNNSVNAIVLFSQNGINSSTIEDNGAVDTTKCSMIVDFGEALNITENTDIVVVWRLQITNK